jgi:hypothetical protein
LAAVALPDRSVTTVFIPIAVTNQMIRNHATPWSGRIRSQSSQVSASEPRSAPYRSKRSLALACPIPARGIAGGESSSYDGRAVRLRSPRVVIRRPSRRPSGCA